MKGYDQQVEWVPAMRADAPAAKASNLHTLEAGAMLPVAQSFVWGLVCMVVTIVLAVSGRMRTGAVALLSALAFAVAFGLAWWLYQRRWFALTKRETLHGLDLNGDGWIGRPGYGMPARGRSAPALRVQVDEITSEGHVKVSKLFDLPAAQSQLEELAEGLLRQKRPFSFREWTGKGKTFSDDQFEALRQEMIKRGLAVIAGADARRGLELTKVGRRVFERILSGDIE
jgi:hypothetical protein